MRLPSLSYLFNSWLGAARRFPLATATALIATVCGIILIGDNAENSTQESVFSLLLTCFLFFPLFITAVAAKESYDSSLIGHLIANVILVVLMITYWKYYAPSLDGLQFEKGVRFFLFTATAHLLVTFIPFLKKSDLNDFWEYNRQLFIQFFTGILYSILIYAGLSFALLAVKYLFDVDFDFKIFGYLFAATAGIFHTSYFLSNFPNDYQFSIEKENFNRGFVNLIKFVFISMVALYFVILYSYGLKILFTWDLPEGWVSTLVIGFSVAGVLTYLLNYLLPEIEGSGWVKIFRKYFFYILPGAVVLLFVAISKRIGDYGVTEERYFILLTGLWLAGISLYFIFSKKDDIRAIPITLAIGCLIAAIGGPISAFSVSGKSQMNRLKTILTAAEVLNDGKITKAEPEFNSEGSEDVVSIIRYLGRSEKFHMLSGWFPNDTLKNDSKNYYQTGDKILGNFGVSQDAIGNLTNYKYRNFYSIHKEPVDIQNFEFYTKFNLLQRVHDMPEEQFYFTQTEDEKGMIFRESGNPIDTLDLSELLAILEKDFAENSDLPIQQMSHLHNGANYSFLITFDNLNFIVEDGENKITNANGNVFWRKK